MPRAKVFIVTGLKQLDTALQALGPKMANKFTRKALRNCAKKTTAAAKAIVEREAFNTGTLADSFKVRALKPKKGRNVVGTQMFVDADKLFAKYEEAYGFPPHPMKGQKRPHYYLASIEFGFQRPNGQHVPAIRPMRRAIYDNAAALQAFFIGDVKEMLREVDKGSKR